jgi:hypothetical protein
MVTKIYKPTDKLTFGKNKGFTLEVVWKYQPTYISWLILNDEIFCIEIESFRNLPKPTTPYNIRAINGSEEIKKLRGAQIITQSDSSNVILTVDMIIQGEKAGIFNLAERKFWFSNEVLEKNAIKISNIKK